MSSIVIFWQKDPPPPSADDVIYGQPLRHILQKYEKNNCENKKNGGGDSNLRYKTYTDKI